jgi:hypothetical protein
MLDAVYYEVQRALISSFNDGIGATNLSKDGATNGSKTFINASNFDGKAMQGLVTIIKSYGNGAVIFATPEFVAEMQTEAAIIKGTDAYAGVYHPQDLDDIRNTGFIQMFRGTPIVQLRQSYTDDTHENTWLNPQYAFVLPTNGEKVVKIVFEGKTQVRDWNNPDGSMEMHIYKKLGAAILSTHNWGIYRNWSIENTQELETGIFNGDFPVIPKPSVEDPDGE